jgi:hypothetical protein
MITTSAGLSIAGPFTAGAAEAMDVEPLELVGVTI